jgi:hypothetical protein
MSGAYPFLDAKSHRDGKRIAASRSPKRVGICARPFHDRIAMRMPLDPVVAAGTVSFGTARAYRF